LCFTHKATHSHIHSDDNDDNSLLWPDQSGEIDEEFERAISLTPTRHQEQNNNNKDSPTRFRNMIIPSSIERRASQDTHIWPSSNEPVGGRSSQQRGVTSPTIKNAARKAQQRFKDEETKKKLFDAVRSQDVFKIREIVSKDSKSLEMTLDAIGSRAVHIAADLGHSIVLEALLEMGADVASRDRDGNEALHNAAASDSVSCIQALIRHGANPSSRNEDSYTPINLAEHFGSRRAVLELSTL